MLTYGLTHIALAVADLDRSSAFYKHVFGVIEVYRGADSVQLQTPGSRDVLVFERKPGLAGKAGGIVHFGFRLRNPEDIHEAARLIQEAGGTLSSRGEFVPGVPYLYAFDPDGYEIEIWFEPPTPVDPPISGEKLAVQ